MRNPASSGVAVVVDDSVIIIDRPAIVESGPDATETIVFGDQEYRLWRYTIGAGIAEESGIIAAKTEPGPAERRSAALQLFGRDCDETGRLEPVAKRSSDPARRAADLRPSE